MMNNKIQIETTALNKIVRFYYNALKKYPNTYTIEDAYKDAMKASKDIKFLQTSNTKQEWANKGYKVVRNGCGWYFAYYVSNGVAYVVDVENYRNMNEHQTQPMKQQNQQFQYQSTNYVYSGYRLVKSNNGMFNFLRQDNTLLSSQWFKHYKTFRYNLWKV